MSKAKLFVVSAPSGCGKGTVLAEVFKGRDVYYSVSCTTRKPRDGEVDGVNYFFIDNNKFEEMIKNNEFLEYAQYASNSYGTPLKPVLDKLEAGTDVVLEIEPKGAFQVKKAMPEAVMLFILPPSVAELKRRLYKRGTETDDVIAKRLAASVDEIKKAYDYDYVIMNDALEDAVADFIAVFESAKSENSNGDKFKSNNINVKNMIDEVLRNA
ncbi:MAG: guanylate kinase [Oscillospiraceae bacterium]